MRGASVCCTDQDDVRRPARHAARGGLGAVMGSKGLKALLVKDKEDLIRQVLPHIARKSADILDRPVPPIEPIIAKIVNMVGR